MANVVAEKDEACANCGARLRGPFCSACGQSSKTLKRPALALLQDVAEGVTNWDGRFQATLRTLFARPGEVTRDYLNGRRARFTPPFRLYVMATLVFFTAMALSGITVVGMVVDHDILTSDRADEAEAALTDPEVVVGLRLFRPPWAPPPEPVDVEALGNAPSSKGGTVAENLDGWFETFAFNVIADPQRVEEELAVALGQTLLLMVVGFSLLNLLLHPRAPLVTHPVHALYMHAALLPPVAVIAVVSVFSGVISAPLSLVIGLGGVVLMIGYVGWSDRNAYGSSLLGACLRVPVLTLGYVIIFVNVAVALSWLAVR